MATGPNLTTHIPILQVQNKANTTPFTYANPELASQTFLFGTPLMLDATGYTKAWDGTTFTNAILGVAESFGQNLGSNGLGAPAFPWGGIQGSGALQTYGSVPNQPLGVNIAPGAPVVDGRSLFMSPAADNVFEAIFDNSGTINTSADITPVQSDIGKLYGLTKDTNGYWYVDKNKATAGTNTCVQIQGINNLDGSTANARVRFSFVPANAVQTF
jgi:hypothetical protein